MPIFMQYGSTPGIRTSKLTQVHGMSMGSEAVSPRSLVSSFSSGVISPRDVATGQAAGRRIHKPLTIVKEVDKSDALLTHLLHSGRMIPKLYLNFYSTPSPTGHPVLSMSLSDVAVNVALKANTGPVKSTKPANLKELEEVAFTFQKIEVTFKSGGAAAKDDWTQ